MYLLDTLVISEITKRKRNPGVLRWLEDRNHKDAFILVVSIGEIQRGIQLPARKNPVFLMKLSLWMESFTHTWVNNILPVSLEIALEWGNILAILGNSGADNLIAAAARIHGLTVVTRNVKHFERTGIAIINPWI